MPEDLRQSPFKKLPVVSLQELEPILQKHLKVATVQFDLNSIQTIDLDSILNMYGHEPFIQGVHLSPINTFVFLVFKAAEVEKGHEYLTKGRLPSDTEILKGVVKFLSLKGLAAIDELHIFKGLSMSLQSQVAKEGLYELFDMQFTLPGLSMSFGLMVHEEALKNLQHFYQNHPQHMQHHKVDVDLDLHLELGSIGLTKKELESLQPLDLIHLDGIIKDALEQIYEVQVSYKNTPLMHAHFEDNNLFGFSPLTAKTQERFMPSSDENPEHFFDEDLEHQEESLDIDLEQEIEEPKKARPAVKLHEVPLDCKIELGSINVPYHTLESLTPQSTIKIDIDPKQVYLTLNGQILHRGEIVEFDQQLFFKVLE